MRGLQQCNREIFISDSIRALWYSQESRQCKSCAEGRCGWHPPCTFAKSYTSLERKTEFFFCKISSLHVLFSFCLYILLHQGALLHFVVRVFVWSWSSSFFLNVLFCSIEYWWYTSGSCLQKQCKFCDKVGTIAIVEGRSKPYTMEDSEARKFTPIGCFDCRGIEPVDFSLREGWTAEAVWGFDSIVKFPWDYCNQ
jgi:hypothetical protein